MAITVAPFALDTRLLAGDQAALAEARRSLYDLSERAENRLASATDSLELFMSSHLNHSSTLPTDSKTDSFLWSYTFDGAIWQQSVL